MPNCCLGTSTLASVGREPEGSLHDLVLSQAGSLRLHGVSTARSLVFNKAQAERASAVLVAGEFLDSSVGIFSSVESNNTSSARSTIGLILDFGLFNLSNGGEKLNKILIAGRPWKL